MCNGRGGRLNRHQSAARGEVNPLADASFLVSFVANDEHGAGAQRWWMRHRCVMFINLLALFEAENTIRVMRLARDITRAEEHKALQLLAYAVLEGLIVLKEVPNRRLYPEAKRLSQHHTEKAGFGAVDILHVACAKDMQATVFLSFDDRQKRLAKAEGMEVAP